MRSLNNICKFYLNFLVLFNVFNLIICAEDDSLQDALEAVYRRHRDLDWQDDGYFGQPENIGYGFQKNFGIFSDAPASYLGPEESREELQNSYPSYVDEEKRRNSNFRERVVSDRRPTENGVEYLELLQNLWNKYQQQQGAYDLEDLTDEQVEEILSNMNERQSDGYEVPLRNRRNYRVFDHMNERNKRYPSFGNGLMGKRNSQHISYQTPPENNFLYSLKYVNPSLNREAVEALQDKGFSVAGDEKDKDVLRILQKEEERNSPYWLDNADWDDNYESTNEKRQFFKQHNGVHLNRKRFPVKRSSNIPLNRVRKETKPEKVDKEIEGLFGSKKKATENNKKNPTKVTKKVRRQEPSTKEQISYRPIEKEDKITNLFHVSKKSVSQPMPAKKDVDWSKYFGINKKNSWFKNDYENNFFQPKSKRYWHKRGGYEIPFDTRVFNTNKRIGNEQNDMDNSIRNMEDKIGVIEEKIIDDAVKYTGAHTGLINNQHQLSNVKTQVINNLEAAYSLEKMRNALEEFKNSIRSEKSANQGTENPMAGITSTTEQSKARTAAPGPVEAQVEDKDKRISVKKEMVDDNDDCPILEKVLHNCVLVEEVHGVFVELLLPLCTLHQVCVLCQNQFQLASSATCDIMYLTEAQNLCQGEDDCLSSAKESMFALKDLSVQSDLSGDTCMENPCIQRYFLETPAAVVPMEFAK